MTHPLGQPRYLVFVSVMSLVMLHDKQRDDRLDERDLPELYDSFLTIWDFIDPNAPERTVGEVLYPDEVTAFRALIELGRRLPFEISGSWETLQPKLYSEEWFSFVLACGSCVNVMLKNGMTGFAHETSG